MSIAFIAFAGIVIVLVVAAIREWRSEGAPRGPGTVDVGADGGSPLPGTHSVGHSAHPSDFGHGGFDGAGHGGFHGGDGGHH